MKNGELIFSNDHVEIKYSASYIVILHKRSLELIHIPAKDFTLAASVWLHLNNFDVTKREPGLKSCPFCFASCELAGGATVDYYAVCTRCNYRGAKYADKITAIKMHNALSLKDEGDQ